MPKDVRHDLMKKMTRLDEINDSQGPFDLK